MRIFVLFYCCDFKYSKDFNIKESCLFFQWKDPVLSLQYTSDRPLLLHSVSQPCIILVNCLWTALNPMSLDWKLQLGLWYHVALGLQGLWGDFLIAFHFSHTTKKYIKRTWFIIITRFHKKTAIENWRNHSCNLKLICWHSVIWICS